MPRFLRRAANVLALTLVASLQLATACVHACPEGCESILWVYVSEPNDVALRDGTYEIDLTLDGAIASATCDVMDGASLVECTDELAGVLYAPLFGGTGEPHRRLEFHLRPELPETVGVRVAVDGLLVLDETFRPEYANPDPGCFDDCMQADKALTLAP